MLGIGLGGFMDGFQKAQDFKMKQRQQERLDQRAEREQTLNQREDVEYNRALSQRNEIDAINAGAKAEFDKRIAAGTEQPDNFDAFWSKYTIPKMVNTYRAQGNLDMARKAQEWGDSDDARAGGKLFMSSLSKLQVGDYDGAIEDAIAGSKRQGYFAHGFEITGKDTLVTQKDGPVVGYQFNYKGADGKEGFKRVRLSELGSFIAGIGNPDAAWKSQLEAQKQAATRATEREDYVWKKQADKAFSDDSDKLRTKAIETLRKRMDGGLAGTDRKFDDLPRAEQEKMIDEETALQKGPGISAPGIASSAPASSLPHKLGNKLTGKLDDPAAARPPASAAPQARPSRPSPEQSRRSNMDYMLKEAEQALADGHRPEAIADGLIQNGIPQDQWPPSLTTALSGKGRLVTGLNVR